METEALMPLACFPHDWTEPMVERVQIAKTTRFPLTRLHYIRRCIACDKVEEVYPETIALNRVRTIPFSTEP